MNSEAIALARQQHVQSLGYLYIIQSTTDEDVRDEHLKKYAELQIEMSAPHVENALNQSFNLSEIISNAKPIADIKIADGRVVVTEIS